VTLADDIDLNRSKRVGVHVMLLLRRPRRTHLPCICAGWLLLLTPERVAAQPPGGSAASTDPSIAVLADSLARLVREAIPPEYERREDWGATRDVTVGYRVDGKPFHYHVHRREKAVNHGTWKHYQLRLVEPERNLAVQFVKLSPIEPGRFAFTLRVSGAIDAWARAKVYETGVHLIAVEMESDMRLQLEVDGEVAVRLQTAAGSPAIVVEPRVTDARLALNELNVRRVSNANGPLVRQLGDGLRRLVENETDGPRLTAKLNGAIEKKRERLVFKPHELLGDSWLSAFSAAR
jgi:hypothetical protein